MLVTTNISSLVNTQTCQRNLTVRSLHTPANQTVASLHTPKIELLMTTNMTVPSPHTPPSQTACHDEHKIFHCLIMLYAIVLPYCFIFSNLMSFGVSNQTENNYLNYIYFAQTCINLSL